MPEPGFRPFGPDHLAVIGLTIVLGALLILGARPLRKVGDDRIFRYSVAATLVLNEVISWFYLASGGLIVLPLQLCDIAIFIMAWALLKRNRYVGELAFFWGLGASLQAVLTPDLTEGFPDYEFIRFFLSHCGVVLSAVYLLARGWFQLTAISVWRVFLITNGYVVFAGIFNWIFGTNFGYLAAKPDQPSLLDYLGPWPYYIFWSEFIALGIFFLCYAFARFVNRWAGRETS